MGVSKEQSLTACVRAIMHGAPITIGATKYRLFKPGELIPGSDEREGGPFEASRYFLGICAKRYDPKSGAEFEYWMGAGIWFDDFIQMIVDATDDERFLCVANHALRQAK